MEEKTATVFRVNYSESATIGGVVTALLLSIPFVVLLFLGAQGPIFFLVFISSLFVLVPGLIIYMTVKARNMSYEIGKDEIKVNFTTKIRAPYHLIQKVEIVDLTLQLRIFGGSWPGLHWGLFKTTQGKANVYATKTKGEFILISLVDGQKIAITPADPQAFLKRINEERSKFGTATAKQIELSASYSKKLVYTQIAIVTGAFLAFLACFLSVYPSLPEIVPVHFNFNWVPDRWAPKSELLVLAGLAAIFPSLNGILMLKFGKYDKNLLIFLGIIFVLVEALFMSIIYGIQGFV